MSHKKESNNSIKTLFSNLSVAEKSVFVIICWILATVLLTALSMGSLIELLNPWWYPDEHSWLFAILGGILFIVVESIIVIRKFHRIKRAVSKTPCLHIFATPLLNPFTFLLLSTGVIRLLNPYPSENVKTITVIFLSLSASLLGYLWIRNLSTVYRLESSGSDDKGMMRKRSAKLAVLKRILVVLYILFVISGVIIIALYR